MESLGQRITHYRKKIGISQKDLADAIEVSSTVLNYYEKDKRKPNVLILIRLARALNITGDALLGLEPHPDMITQNKNEFLMLNSLRKLDCCGQDKVLEYISDIMASGKYVGKR